MSIISKLVPILAKRKAKVIENILSDPIGLTDNKLNSIIEKHSHTKFGKDHRYESIKTPEQFAEQVPLYDYYSMAPYFDRVKETPEQPIVTADPIVWYVQSSGSTGKPKALPISKAGMDDYSIGTTLSIMAFVNAGKKHRNVFNGTILSFAAPAKLREINGVPVGYMSGIAKEMAASAILRRLVKPGVEVFNMTDIEEKLWEYAKVAVQENISALVGITTLSLAFIRKMQNDYGTKLLKEFRGTKHEEKVRKSLNDDGTLNLEILWPNLTMFGATGVDADPYKSWIKDTLPQCVLWDNYAASEGLYGVTLLDNTDNGIQLLTNTNYFEFIPEKEVDKEDPKVIPLSDVKKGHRYEMVLTNMLGYTRYRVGDMLTFIDTDPYSVHRIGRKGRVVNLAGEKLTDAHVNEGIVAACRKTGAQLADYTVLGNIDGSRAYYIISAMFQNKIELAEFARAFDDAVGANNGEFKHSLEFGALDPSVAIRMKTSHTEGIIKSNHIQSKPLPLSMAETPAMTMSSVGSGEIAEGA